MTDSGGYQLAYSPERGRWEADGSRLGRIKTNQQILRYMRTGELPTMAECRELIERLTARGPLAWVPDA